MFGAVIPPLYRWAAIAAAVVLGALALVAWDAARIKRAEARGDARARAEIKVQSDAQTQRIRDLQRAAETRYTVQTEVRDRFITQTITEVRHAAAPVASCALPADLVRLLNAASRCATGDPAAAGGAGEPVCGAAGAP